MERRVYQRATIGIDTLFVLESDTLSDCEFIGQLENISEVGIQVNIVSSDFHNISENIHIGDSLSFQSIDRFELYGKLCTAVFNGNAVIVRKSIEEGVITLGCKIKRLTPDLEKYITDKKLSIFLHNMHGN